MDNYLKKKNILGGKKESVGLFFFFLALPSKTEKKWAALPTYLSKYLKSIQVQKGERQRKL